MKALSRTELATWDVYFSTICGMRFHPRNVPSLAAIDPDFRGNILIQCAEVADMMMVLRRARDSQAYRQESDG